MLACVAIVFYAVSKVMKGWKSAIGSLTVSDPDDTSALGG